MFYHIVSEPQCLSEPKVFYSTHGLIEDVAQGEGQLFRSSIVVPTPYVPSGNLSLLFIKG